MLNYIWAFMVLAGILYAAVTGNIDAVSNGALDSAKEAITLCITMLGVLSLWTGLMEIAKQSGAVFYYALYVLRNSFRCQSAIRQMSVPFLPIP